MTPSSVRARSGLRLAGAQVAASAHNTANQLTAGFRRQQATGVESASGVEVRISTAARGGAQPLTDVLDARRGAVLYRANLHIIAAEDERTGTTLDLVG